MTLVSHESDVRMPKTPGVDCICRRKSNTKLYKRLGLGMTAMRVNVNMQVGRVSKERYRRAYEVSGLIENPFTKRCDSCRHQFRSSGGLV